eukprot:6910617-Heterocapsa_arctica.AAC.1
MPGHNRRSSASRAPTNNCTSSSWRPRKWLLALLLMRLRLGYAFFAPAWRARATRAPRTHRD